MKNIDFDVSKLVSRSGPLVGRMMTYHQIVAVLENLKWVIVNNIPGDIVELGCNVGSTTVHMQKLLDEFGSDKIIHVYDSWEGLPEKNVNDNVEKLSTKNFKKGDCKTSKESFIDSFDKAKLKLPIIHSGWFAEIPDEEYPEKICFAFFDGDFYQSIIDSFNKVYHKVEKNGIILLDDCGWSALPGVEKACLDFLADKPEELDLKAYPDKNGIYGNNNGGGKIIKM